MKRLWGLLLDAVAVVPEMFLGPRLGREEAVVRFKSVVPSVDEQTAWIEAVTVLAQAGIAAPSAEDVEGAARVIVRSRSVAVEDLIAEVQRAREEGWL